LPRIEKIIGKIPEKETQHDLILGLQNIEDRIENFEPERDYKTEAEDHGQVLYPEPLQEGRFGKIIENDIRGTDEK
jgi:hypothetical protein